MTPVENAIDRARRGIDWSYPCLIWVADYLLAATGVDYASGFRRVEWDEATAKKTLVRLAAGGQGRSAVEKTLDTMARQLGWEPVEENRQGAIIIGVYSDLADNGSAAIFDGTDRWIVAQLDGGCISMGRFPDRAWEVSCVC